jgi:hypothetical protein
MADRTLKPDSGNDLVLQNNGGSSKIEIPNSGDISITGTIGSGTFNGILGGSVSGFGLITHVDNWRYTTTLTGTGLVSGSDWERNDSDNFTSIGTGFSAPSSGVFTFPVIGMWLIIATAQFKSTLDPKTSIGLEIQTTTNNSTYTARTKNLNSASTTNHNVTTTAHYLFRCTDLTTHKVRFNRTASGSAIEMSGSTSVNDNQIIFMRIGNV